MDWDTPPTLKQFAEIFNGYLKEIGCMNNQEGYINSHKIIGGIHIYCDDDMENSYVISSIDFEQLNCGCWSDVTISIKKVK
jgi:hypothetical protein